MAAMMGGTMRSPLAATVFAAELTHDFGSLPALLIACASSYCVTVLLMRRSILTEKLARRGQHVACEYSVDPFDRVRVGDVAANEVPMVPHDMALACLFERINGHDPILSRRQGTLIVDEAGDLCGILTRGDLLRAMRRDPAGTMSVGAVGRREMVVTHPDETLRTALEKMLAHDVGRLPVVERGVPRRVVGYLGRTDVLAARGRVREEEQVRQRGPNSALFENDKAKTPFQRCSN
jgi:CIC family chloride channel protein